MRFDELLKTVKVLQSHGDLGVSVKGVVHDSRRVRPGDLFVALRGTKTDGHHFVADAVRRGARALLLEEPPPEVPIPWAVVSDTRETLGEVAARFYGEPSRELTLIGVTGTNGKTTVTYLLEAILREAGAKVGVMGTINYRWRGKARPAPNTTPPATELQQILREMVSEGVTHGVMEVSSHALVQRRLKACHLDIGIFTNLSHEHLNYHGTLEAYLEAKALLFREVLKDSQKDPWAIYNGDDPMVRKVAEAAVGLKKLRYGRDGLVRPIQWEGTLKGTKAILATPKGRMELCCPLVGAFNLDNIMAAVAAAVALGVDEGAIVEGVARVVPPPGRMERVGDEPMVFVDYAHTPDALEKALLALLPFTEGRLIVVFGCGGERDRTKRPLMGRIASRLASKVIITSDNPRGEDPLKIIEEIERGLQGEAEHRIIPDRRKAIQEAIRMAGPRDVVLIAGKGHEAYQIVGGRRLPFDDRLEAKRALAELRC